MFGKPKPPFKKMRKYSDKGKYHDGVRVAIDYIKKTKKAEGVAYKKDIDFLNQFATLLCNANCMVAALDIINEIPDNWHGYHSVLPTKGRCLLDMGKFDEAEKVFVEICSKVKEDGTRMMRYGENFVEGVAQNYYQAFTFLGVIAYARDFSPETAIDFFDQVLEINPKFEMALAFKNDIITMQKGGIGQFLLSITEIKEQIAERQGIDIWRGTGDPKQYLTQTEIDEKNTFTTIVNEYK